MILKLYYGSLGYQQLPPVGIFNSCAAHLAEFPAPGCPL